MRTQLLRKPSTVAFSTFISRSTLSMVMSLIDLSSEKVNNRLPGSAVTLENQIRRPAMTGPPTPCWAMTAVSRLGGDAGKRKLAGVPVQRPNRIS